MSAKSFPGADRGRLLQLDVLRGIAIVLVLFRHPAVSLANSKSWFHIALRGYTIGWTGVDLFFVLSGFLIGGLLFSELRLRGRLDVKRFLIRRGFKIWPSYFLLIIFMFCFHRLSGLTHSTSEELRLLWPNLVHLQNYFGSEHGLTWSLAIEEHFYLILPLLLLGLTRTKGDGPLHAIRPMPWIAGGVAIICLSLRVLNWNRPYGFYTHVAPTHLRVDALFFGVFLAYLHHFHPHVIRRVAQHRVLLLLTGLALVLPLAMWDPKRRVVWTIGFTMLYVGYGAILLAAIYSDPETDWLGRALHSIPARILASVGIYSYAIYLWHWDTARPLMQKLLLPHMQWLGGRFLWPVGQILYIGFAFLAGAIITRIADLPALAMRNRLFPARVATPLKPLPAAVSAPLPTAEPILTSV